jgi:hypothetical protein
MSSNPLLVFGMDAADPQLIRQWSAEGLLPNITRILQSGCFALTAGSELISEHGIWTSLTSGISRGQHGYHLFRQLLPGSYRVQPFDACNLDLKPFWKDATSNPNLIVDVPDTQVVPGLPGVQIANWGVHDLQGPPAASPASALALFGPPRPIPEVLAATPEQDIAIRNTLHARMIRKSDCCQQLIREISPRLAFIVFGESHTAGHQFWKYRSGSGELQHALRDIYLALDSQLGRLIDAYPTPPNVALVTTVGLRDEWPSEGFLSDFCLKLGYSKPPARSTRASWNPLSIARTLLPQSVRDRLSQHLPRATQDKWIADKFEASLDWSQTKIFALPYFYMGLLRVNLIGREPHGTVTPGAEYTALLDEITSQLLQLRDPVDGSPAVAKVHRTTDHFGASPHLQLPDLFVEWTPTRQLRRRLIHPLAEILQDTPSFCRGTEHTQKGFFALAGPNIQQLGEMEPISLLDVAPTLAHLSGIESDRYLPVTR